ncbi:MAG: protoporphyrinogen oxidase [Austwickia sp.]|nr:protoporphyrinogen oxidase [Austwickia sp.]
MTGAGRRAVVIGGGISGLVAARRLAAAGHHVTLLEADDRLGGQIHTVEVRGGAGGTTYDVDLGAEAMHTMAPRALALIDELGLRDSMVTARTGESYLWTPRGRRRLPAGVGPAGPTRLRPVLASGVMSLPGLLRAGLEPAAARVRRPVPLGPGHDIAVGDFVAGRFGRQVVDRFVDPLLGGLHSGDVRRLSLRATTPTLVAAAAQGRSLMPLRLRDVPARARGRVRRAAARPTMDFLSWPGGLATFLTALLADLPPGALDVRTGTAATGLAAAPGGGYRVRTAAGDITGDVVVLAVPAWAAAPLLRPHAPRAADTLAATRTASTVSVLLGFPRAAVAGIPALAGNGLLVPSTTGTLLKAVTNLTAKWPHYRDGELFLMRLSAGRDGQDTVAGMSDEALVDHLRRDLRRFTGLDVAPALVRVRRWPQGLPQLTVGHVDRTAYVRRELQQALPGVALAGAAYDGIGLGACIASAEDAVRQITKEMTA